MAGWPQFASLRDDELLWMLVWLGPFNPQPENSQPGLFGFIAPISHSARKPPSKINRGRFPTHFELHRVLRVEFSLGDLAALHPSMMFRHRKLVRNHRPLTTTATFLTDFDSQRPLRLGGSSDLNRDNTLTGGAWPFLTHSGYVELEAQGSRLFVPALEIMRWCYGTSSRMLQAIISNEIEDILQTLDQTSVFNSQSYTMTLPSGFPVEDAPQLAWLALDPVARHTVLQTEQAFAVGQHTAPDGLYVYPKVAFPYQGLRQMTCQGRPLDTGFLVTRILEVEIELPFNEVVLRKQSTTQNTAIQPVSTTTRTIRRKVKNASRLTLYSNAEPRDNRSATRLPALPSQFTDRVAIALQQTDTDGQISVTPFFIPPPRKLTTGTGKDPNSTTSRGILQGEKSETPIENDDFRGFRQMLRHLNLPYTERFVNNSGGSESRFSSLYKPGGERVGCLIVEIKHDGQFWYLLEKERVTEACSPLLLARRTSQADDLTLSALMDTWSRKRRWPGEAPDWSLQRIAHNFATPQTYAKGIRRRLQLP